jgi:MFS family permease
MEEISPLCQFFVINVPACCHSTDPYHLIRIGILTMIIPLYQAELAHPDIRGLITGLQQFMIGIGGVCGSWISYGTYVGFSDNHQWRVPFGIQIIPAAVLSILIFLFPESPRWLIKKGRNEDGLRTLAKLHSNGDVTDTWVSLNSSKLQIRSALREKRRQSHFQTSSGPRQTFTESCWLVRFRQQHR